MAVLTKPPHEATDAEVPYRYFDVTKGKSIWLNDLAQEMADESGFTKKAAKDFIRTLSVLLRRHMARGDMVQIKGIGKFFSYIRYPHQRYSFQDECMVDYAPKVIPKFLFSESFVEYFREHFGQEEDSKIGDEEEYDAEEQI